MKKINYLAMLLAAGMFAACSDTLEDATGGTNTNTPATGEGYVKVAINMPTTSGTSTRSTDNDEQGGAVVDLEDGEANEYNIENAIIAFFKAGTSENADEKATFVKAYAFNKSDLSVGGSDETPQVTEQVTTITEAPKVASTEQLYALAILNYNSDIVSVVNDASNDGVLKIDKTSLTASSTLADVQKKISVTLDQSTNKTNDAFLNKFTGGSSTATRNQFTMTNAPLSSAAGTSESIANAKAYTLVPVTVYDDKAAAEAGDVATIYVERIVAKVTLAIGTKNKVSDEDNQISVSKADGTKGDDIVEITGWYLNVTNNSTKLVRDVKGFKTTDGWLATGTGYEPERFAGTRGIDASFGVNSEQKYYRIYWAQDCNYFGTGQSDATTVTDDFTTYHHEQGSSTITPVEPAWNTKLVADDADNACYCLENTMDYNQQMENRTTGVLIKTKYYTKFLGEQTASPKNFFICGTNATKYPEEQVGESSGEHTPAFIDYVIDEANKLIEVEDNKISTTDSKGLSLKDDLASGTYTDIDDVFTFTATDTKLATQKAAVQAVVGGRISYYGGNGESYYYSSIIRHFQDDEGVDVDEAGVADASEYTLKHLGRYGVVRNNWYEISINSVSGPGTPTIEEPGEEPDDSSEGYMRCAINVLSWAKRSQSVDL